MIDVSIVIVCMNNLNNLYPCLRSIKTQTKNLNYETFVVAYLFSAEYLQKVKEDFPWVTIIESNEIRGFSENNNLALKHAKGKYCFVLNDDTEMKMPVIEELVNTIDNLPEDVAIVSPVTLFRNGTVQYSGRRKHTWKDYIMMELLRTKRIFDSRGDIKEDVYQTYNIIGAAFLIKRKIFERVGWFDERFFFCPEDVALSTKLNEMGYRCFVNRKISIYHYASQTINSTPWISTATQPASYKGFLLFFSDDNKYAYIGLAFLTILAKIPWLLKHMIFGVFRKIPNKDYIYAIADLNVIKACLSKKGTKELFIKFYNDLPKRIMHKSMFF